MTTTNLKAKLLPYLLVLPAMAGIFAFFFYPFILNIINSFMQGTVQASNRRFVGFDNYIFVLRDPHLIRAVITTIQWTVLCTIFQFLYGFAVAIYCSSGPKIGKTLKIIFVIPWAIPGIVASLSWRWIFNGDVGILNTLLFNAGIIDEFIGWISDPRYAMTSVIIANVWKGAPFYMLMIYAALTTIPLEYYEAARIDGGGPIRIFFNITLPLVKDILIMSLTLGILWTSNFFEGIFALTGGGPARVTETLPLFIYNTAFSFFRMNDAAIPSIIIFIFCAGLGLLYVRLKKSQEEVAKW